MRKIIIKVLGGCAAAALTATALGAAASPASAATGTHLTPLAGDGHYLVYSKNSGAKNCSNGSPTLHVRTESGHTSTLPTPHQNHGTTYGLVADPCYGVDLNGHFLTMQGFSGRGPMYWWDLAKHTHGVRSLPENNVKIVVVGTVQGGWLYVHTDYSDKHYGTATTLYRQGTNGKVTTYAHLPRFSVADIEFDTHGLLTGNGGGPLRYLPLGASTPRTLDSPANGYRGHACTGLTATFAACGSGKESGSGKQFHFQVSITPLSGGKTITSRTAFAPNGGLVYEDSLSVTSRGIVGLLQNARKQVSLRGFGVNGRVTSAPGHGATTLVVAYNKIIVGHEGGSITSQGSVTGKQHTLIAAH